MVKLLDIDGRLMRHIKPRAANEMVNDGKADAIDNADIFKGIVVAKENKKSTQGLAIEKAALLGDRTLSKSGLNRQK
jgi:hypothetical protein